MNINERENKAKEKGKKGKSQSMKMKEQTDESWQLIMTALHHLLFLLPFYLLWLLMGFSSRTRS